MTFFNIADHLAKFLCETVGRAQQESVVIAASRFGPPGIVAFGPANREYATKIIAGRNHTIRAAAVFEHDEIAESHRQVGYQFCADLVPGYLRQLVQRGRNASFKYGFKP